MEDGKKKRGLMNKRDTENLWRTVFLMSISRLAGRLECVVDE